MDAPHNIKLNTPAHSTVKNGSYIEIFCFEQKNSENSRFFTAYIKHFKLK